MDTIGIAKRFQQLHQRREHVSLTLEYIEKERKEAEKNTDWLDQAAYESRIAFLDRLCDWYIRECGEIDEAIHRIETDRYGFCVACHSAIDSHRLELFPQVAFCLACQQARDSVETL